MLVCGLHFIFCCRNRSIDHIEICTHRKTFDVLYRVLYLMYQCSVALCVLVFVLEKILVYPYLGIVYDICASRSIKIFYQYYPNVFKLWIILKEYIVLYDIHKTSIAPLQTRAQPCKFTTPCLVKFCEFLLLCIRNITFPKLIIQILKSRILRMLFSE